MVGFVYYFCVCWFALTLPSLLPFSTTPSSKFLVGVDGFSLASNVPASRSCSSSSPSTRLYFFGNNKNKNTSNNNNNNNKKEPEKKTGTGKTPYNYAGTKVEKDEEVVVPATTYFAQKNDPLIPVIGGSFFLTVFALLGWWLFSPTPESTSTNVKEMTYESMTAPSSTSKRR